MKLIIHIGLPKTGTTFVQNFLLSNKDTLIKNKVFYGGLMFEELKSLAGCDLPPMSPWMLANANTSSSSMIDIAQIVNEFTTKYQNQFNSLLLVNESFFYIPDTWREILTHLHPSIELIVISVLRRQDEWSFSAYKQWVLRDPVNMNNFLNIEGWISENYWMLDYNTQLTKWKSIAKKTFIIKYDKNNKMLVNILDVIGANKAMAENANEYNLENQTPNELALLLRGVFYKNNQLGNRHIDPSLDSLLFESGLDNLIISENSFTENINTNQNLELLFKEIIEQHSETYQYIDAYDWLDFNINPIKKWRDINIDHEKIWQIMKYLARKINQV